MKDYAYDSKHFANVPSPGHGSTTRGRCLHPECARVLGPAHYGHPPRYRDGKTEAGTNAESVWREAVGLPRF